MTSWFYTYPSIEHIVMYFLIDNNSPSYLLVISFSCITNQKIYIKFFVSFNRKIIMNPIVDSLTRVGRKDWWN